MAPTLLEAAGIPEPTSVNGVQQSPMEGVSMRYSFEAADAPERHEQQYFEMFGNRGIYRKGWAAVTKHRTPWIVGGETVPFDDDVWKLYDESTDPSQTHDLAAEMPEKLHELQRLWLIEAARYNVLPLDDRTAERFNADIAGRPELMTAQTQLLYGGMGRLTDPSQTFIRCSPPGSSSSPHGNTRCSRPPRAAYSHSASVGSRLPAQAA